MGAVCNNAIINDESLLGQPTEGALLAAAMKHGMYNIGDRYVRLKEYPFSSEQKMMALRCSSKYDRDKAEVYFAKGAIEKILPKCTGYSWNGEVQPMTPAKEQEFVAEVQEIARKGLRTVVMAKGHSLTELVYMGAVGICDPPRPRVREAISLLKESGVQVKMVTGDCVETAAAIGELIIKIFFLFIFIKRFF